MAFIIPIDPVTRIEGHAKITIQIDGYGNVQEAKFHVVEFRAFEKFCEGRPFREMPSITARVCGICPVSHLLASAKAGDAIQAVKIPTPVEKLRSLMNLGQIIQSHALSFFHLSSPDLFLGFDSDPKKRNIFGLMEFDKDFARRGIRLRKFGQEIIEILGGQKIHPAWAIPGGVRNNLSNEGKERILEFLPEVKDTILRTLSTFKKMMEKFKREVLVYGNFPTLFLGMVDENGNWAHHVGYLRFIDSMGNIIADKIEPDEYQNYIGEASEKYSYLKSPFYKTLGYPEGIYRVGPLARLNVCNQIGTMLADAELKEYRAMAGGNTGIVNSAFYYHYARLIEILACIEKIEELIHDPDLQSNRLRSRAGINRLEGVGISEAPRGTLFHHYNVNENGMIEKVNMIIATGQNNIAMNRTVEQIARHYIKAPKIPEAMLNRVEHGIRCYDPCLSCSTHAVGQMPLHIILYGPDGEKLDEIKR